MRLTPALLSVAFSHLVFAYPKFSAPAAGDEETGGSSITITWADNGEAPSISDLASYQLDLYAGSNTAYSSVVNVKPAGTTFSASSVTATIAKTVGGSTKNA